MIKVGDYLEVVAIYHEKIGVDVPHPERPGVVKDEDGNIYYLQKITVGGDNEQ